MKKLFTFIIALFASVALLNAETYSGSCGENLTWSLNTEDGVLTISGTGAMADYQNATQTPWNGYSSLIQSVIMNDNVTTVGNYAFAFCSNLKNVSLNQTLTTIGEHAFFSCPLLESVVIPDNVIVIGYNAFAQCSWLTSVHIGNKVTTIGKGAFARCGRLSSVVMFNSVTSIGENAFYGCSGLTSVTIPNSVASIGDGAFNGCSNLTTFTNFATTPQPLDPDGISVFGGVPLACTLYVPAESVEAYQAADVWKDFGNILPIEDTPESCITASGTCGAEGDNLTWTLTCDSVLTISGMGAIKKFNSTSRAPWYEYRESIKFAVIEEGITSIGNLAFRDCSVLKNVTIPNSVISIGYDAFGYCSNLTSVIIPNSITSIGSYAFSRSGLTSVTLSNNLTTIETDVFMDCSNLTSVIIPNSITSIRGSAFQGCSGMTSVTFGNGITSIGDLAFCDCNALTNITIPNSVTSIGVAPFSGCDNLTSINVTSDNTNYCSIDGVLFSKDKTALIQYPCGKQGTYTIPNSVISIGEMAFAYCPTLSSITIPSNVTSIDQWAFDSNSLNSITNYATNPQAIHTNVFSHVDKSTCTLYVPAQCLAAYQAADVWKEFGNILPIEGTEESNYATLADIYNMAADSAFTLGAFDVVYVPSFQSGSNMYIKDSTGSCVIYKVNYGLQAGDHVEAGLQGKVSIYNGLHEVIPITAKEELTITHGEAPAPMVATEVPSLNNASQYVVYEGVSFTTDTAFVEGRRHTVYGSWNGQTITFYNQYYIGATLSANKTYNITAVNTIYRTTPQAYPLAVEEVSPAPCIIASGTCGAQGANLTWTLSCDSVLTISGTKMWDLGNDIEHAPWYDYRSAVKSVIIEEGVATIGYYAFQDCNNLTSILIPSSIKYIYGGTFMGCNMLSAIYISDLKAWCAIEFNDDNPLIYGHNLYLNKELVTDLVIPNNVTSINNSAFAGCTSLLSVTIPSSVVSIGENVFKYCSYLTTINVASDNPNYSSIDGVLFNKEQATLLRCPNGNTRTEYSIPNGVTTIGQRSFESCWQLNSIIIPDGVTTIEANAFEGCVNLTSVSIANSVSTIENEAFLGCQKLTSVTNYAANPQTIAATAFSFANQSSCTLYVPAESVEAYQTADVWKEFGNILAIEGDTPEPCIIASGTCGAQGDNLTWTLSCDSVLTISGTGAMEGYNSDDSAPWFSFKYTLDMSVVIEEGVTYIGKDAFAYYGVGIKSVTIPSSVISIGNEAFISSATAFFVDEANPNYSSLDGVLFNKDQTTLIYYPVAKRDAQYTIPNTVNTIGHGAFYGCDYLNSIIIPNSVTAIEESAFRYCRALKSVSIPNSVLTIGYNAFEYCDNLVTANISSSVTSIGNSAFAGCKQLQSINVDEANPNYSSLDGVLFNKDQTKLLQYPNGKGDTLYIIPNTVTTVGSMSFSYILKEDRVKLTSIVIPSSVTTINANAFWDANNLASITNYAVTPQWVSAPHAHISSCTLYVPAQSLEAYQAADFWKDFADILPIEGTEEPIETIEGNYTIYYVGKDSQDLTDEIVTLHVPVAPVIEGFTFLKWVIVAGDLEDGIAIQAVYEADMQTGTPEVYTNPANHAQKLLRNGHVYILTDDRTYTIQGQRTK